MKEYLKNTRIDKIIAIIDVVIALIIFFIALFFIYGGFSSHDYLFVVIVIVIFLLVGMIITKIEGLIDKRLVNRQKYYVIELEHSFNYDEVVKRIDEINKKRIRYDYSDYSNIFSFKKKRQYRLLIIHQEMFILDKYKNIKKKVNYAYNKEYNVDYRVSPRDAYMMFNANIICCDYINDELYKHLSIDCWQGLRRVVGIVDIAIVGNKLIIPSVRGVSELQDINRYIDFNKLIFKTFNAIND